MGEAMRLLPIVFYLFACASPPTSLKNQSFGELEGWGIGIEGFTPSGPADTNVGGTSEYDGAYIGNYQYSISTGACADGISPTQVDCEAAGQVWTTSLTCGLAATALSVTVQEGTVTGTGFPGTTDCESRISKLDFVGTVRPNDSESDTGEDVEGLASGTYSEAQTIFFNGNWEGTVSVCVGCSTTGEDVVAIEGIYEEQIESTTFGSITVNGSFRVEK